MLDYIITTNHIHTLVLDRGKGEIAQSMSFIAGRTAQEYNRRISAKMYSAMSLTSKFAALSCYCYLSMIEVPK